MSEDWKRLIDIFGKNKAYSDYVAECVFAYLDHYGNHDKADLSFQEDLIRFIEGVYK